MDFARLTTGCTFKYATWTSDFIRVDEAVSISPNQARATAMLLPFKLRGQEAPADVQAEADKLLAINFKLTPTLTTLHKYVHITATGEEVDWTPSVVDIQDPGYVLVSGTLAPELSEAELAELVSAATTATAATAVASKPT